MKNIFIDIECWIDDSFFLEGECYLKTVLHPSSLHQFSSVAQSCLTLCGPMNRSTPSLPVHHHLPEFTQLMCIESVMPSSHLILNRPLLLLPPIPPNIRVFSNESTLRMRWPKYWSFSFSIIPSKEIPGLIYLYSNILVSITRLLNLPGK